MKLLHRILRVDAHEAAGVAPAVLMFFLLFASYFMLRPVRETMGIVGGIDNLPWLFTATFVATLACLPLFGWIAGKVPRRTIQSWTYSFFGVHLLLFAIGFLQRDGGAVLLGHLANVATIIYFSVLIGGGGLVVKELFNRVGIG